MRLPLFMSERNVSLAELIALGRKLDVLWVIPANKEAKADFEAVIKTKMFPHHEQYLVRPAGNMGSGGWRIKLEYNRISNKDNGTIEFLLGRGSSCDIRKVDIQLSPHSTNDRTKPIHYPVRLSLHPITGAWRVYGNGDPHRSIGKLEEDNVVKLDGEELPFIAHDVLRRRRSLLDFCGPQ